LEAIGFFFWRGLELTGDLTFFGFGGIFLQRFSYSQTKFPDLLLQFEAYFSLNPRFFDTEVIGHSFKDP